MKPGIKLKEEIEGSGAPASRGDTVEFDSQAFLSHGDLVQDRLTTTTKLGTRHVIAGLEYALDGMKVGGFRKVKISPHLAYRNKGVEGKIPPNAVLVYDLWMKRIEPNCEPTAAVSASLGP